MPTTNIRAKRNPSHPSRVDLKIDEIDSMIEDQGVYVKITPSMVCPNRTSVTDTNHPAACTVCGGNSALDLPAHAIEDWVLITSIDKELMFNVPGMFNLKDAKITVRSRAGIKIDYWYKIEVLDHTSIFNELVRRNTTGTDKLRYASAQDIETIAGIYLVDHAGIEWAYNTDFTISGQALTWGNGRGPAGGTVYSIQYPILPTFRVIEFLNADRYYYSSFKQPNKQPVDLPQHAAIRWDFLAAQKGVNEPLGT